MAYNIIEGSTIQFYLDKAFTSISGTAVDPDQVTFGFEIQGQNAIMFTYTWGTGDPTGTIVRTGVGLYYANIDTTNRAGVWMWQWAGKPTSLNHDTTRTQVVIEGTVTVSPRTVG
jgi:hypothetical protein